MPTTQQPGEPASSKQPALQLEKAQGMQSQTRPRAGARLRCLVLLVRLLLLRRARGGVAATHHADARRRTPTQQWRAGHISAPAATSAIPHAWGDSHEAIPTGLASTTDVVQQEQNGMIYLRCTDVYRVTEAYASCGRRGRRRGRSRAQCRW